MFAALARVGFQRNDWCTTNKIPRFYFSNSTLLHICGGSHTSYRGVDTWVRVANFISFTRWQHPSNSEFFVYPEFSAVVVFLFLAGLRFTGAIINGPKFPPKIDFGGPNYRQQRLMLRLTLTGPAGLCWQLDRQGRTPSCCVAWQLQHCLWCLSSMQPRQS